MSQEKEVKHELFYNGASYQFDTEGEMDAFKSEQDAMNLAVFGAQVSTEPVEEVKEDVVVTSTPEIKEPDAPIVASEITPPEVAIPETVTDETVKATIEATTEKVEEVKTPEAPVTTDKSAKK